MQSSEVNESKPKKLIIEKNESSKKNKKRRNTITEVEEIDIKKVKSEYSVNEVVKNNHNGNINNDENNPITADDNNEEDNEVEVKCTSKEVDQMTGKFLRKSFSTEGGIDILKKFIAVCQDNNGEKDLVGEYLEAGGSILEILKLLDTNEKKNLKNASIIFSAMYFIIMKITAKYPQHQSSAGEACRHIFNSHLSLIHSMMSQQSSPKQRKIILQFLTALVTLGGSLPRELLNHLSFHSQVIDFLTQQTKPTDLESVRKCFIHFVLAFLVDGNSLTIKSLLEKRGLLSSIFPGLIYDSHSTVNLVLTTIKTYVLENNSVMKTTKLHVFCTPVVKSLVCLYNWKGPKNWPGMNKKHVKITEHVDPDEKKVVTEAVHVFLITLLTSTRYGIIFNDRSLGTSGRKHNQLVNTVLESLDKPWEHEKPRDLVIKVLSACPDLVKSQMTYTEAFLEPRISPKWISVMSFVCEVIESIDPENLKPYIVELHLPQLINASLTLTMPQVILKNTIPSSINSSSIIVRQQVCSMLLIMLKQIQKYFKIVKNNFNQSDSNNYQSAVVNYIQKNMPSVKQILFMWNLTLKTEEPSDTLDDEMVSYLPEKIDHLASIVELLEHYRDISSKLFDINFFDVSNKLPEIDLFTDLKNIETTNISKLNEIKTKLIAINFQLNPIAFEIEETIFSKSLIFLISLIEKDSLMVNRTSSILDKQAKNTIKLLLKSLKTFQGYDNQIDIWINCLSYFENEQKNAVARWLVKMFRYSVKNKDEFFKNNKKNKNENEESAISKIKEENSIPDILHIALDYLKNHTNENGSIYMSYVIVLTLHYQKNPVELENLIEDMYGLPNKYISSWIEGIPVSLKKYFPQNIISNYSKLLLSKDTIKFEKLFNGDKLVSFDYGDQKIEFRHQLTVFEASNILQMTLFYLIQFMKKKQLHQELLERFKKTIITFLNIAKSLDEATKIEDLNVLTKFLSMIFNNIMTLKYFSVIVNDNSYEILTASYVDIIKTAVSINNTNRMEDVLFLFKNKFVFELNLLISTTNLRPKLSSYAAELIETFALSNEDIFNLLEKIVNLPVDCFISNKTSLSSWGIIIPKLIKLLTTSITMDCKKEKLTKNVQSVINHLVEMKTKQKIKLIETWEISLTTFFHKYSEYIFVIDDKQFKGLLNTDLTISTIALIRLIISKNDKLIPVLIESYKSNSKLQNQNIIFPIISINSTSEWTQEFLTDLFNKYNEEIVFYLTFSADNINVDWIVTNVDAISCLIMSCFNEEICNKISSTIIRSGDKLEMVDINYIKLLRVLYKKLTTFKNTTTVIKEFIQILIRIFVYSLKKNTKNEEKMFTLCDYLSEAIGDFKQSEENDLFEELSTASSWPQFIRFSLKQGLKKSSNKNNQKDENEKPLEDEKTLPLLETIAKLIDIIYPNNCEDLYVKTIFEMTTSHSEFVNLMLSSENTVKKNLLQLLWVLVRKNRSLMLPTQIPLFLSAYNATLNESDQLILLILRHYEASEIKLNYYKPYLWGEAAANHYSVKGEIDTSLLRQPSIAQVMELFNEDLVNNTVINFPINRSLQSTVLHPPSNVYDPAFFLPLLISSFSVDNVIPCHKIIKSGTLSLIFASCGSTCEGIRLAAFTVLARFYFHLEATKNRNKLLWIRFIDALRNGIASMKEQAEMNSLKNIQLNSFITTFLAKASLISARPLNPLFVPIQSFLMAKPALVLQGIPEFLTLFHSSDINHKLYRHWILEVIRDGMKTDADLKLALKFSVFRMICDFYHCSLADPETKNLILQVLKSATKITMGSTILIRDYGILIWLKEVARKIEKYNLDNVNLVLDIIENLLYTFNSVKISRDNLNHYKFILSSVLNNLSEHIPKDDINVNNVTCKYHHCFTQISEENK
ncbi:nucleolar pre-ribosomal-associated protein [Chelonus insularis]|nr:nucleolar pre-ribosomal-associated protein [Chelonus insularis]